MDRYARDGEQTVEDVFRRVAGDVGQTVQEQGDFYDAMCEGRFIPAGRILAHNNERTMYNCFVLPSPHDSRGGIIDTLKDMVETHSRGGGVGVNVSSLRPRGAIARKVGGTSSGAVSWAALYSFATGLVEQSGSRRGATLICLHDWHPDVREFIHSKREAGKITNANISVLISDAFMDAVQNDREWNLVFPDTTYPEYDELWDGDLDKWKGANRPVVHYETVKAKDLWREIMESAWDSAEPGILFYDHANSMSNTWYFNRLESTNPCFTGDTMIHTEGGIFSALELYDGNIDFKPMVHESKFSAIYSSGCSRVMKTGYKPVYEMVLENRSSIKLTDNHQVWKKSEKGFEWVELKHINIGDEIRVSGATEEIGATSRVVSIEPAGEEDVYDICVPGWGFFVANNMVIHNCGEQWLPGWAVCLLGHIQLQNMVKLSPLSNTLSGGEGTIAQVDWVSIKNTVKTAVRFLDNIIDINPYHNEENERVQKGERRIGLGTMGFAEMLIKLGVRYGSNESVALAESIQRFIAYTAYEASSDLALERGSFPMFDCDKFLQSGFCQTLPSHLRAKIREDGMRNACLMSQAPTGTVGTMVGTSTGIEPFFSFSHWRKTRMGSFEEKHPIAQGLNGDEDYLVCAMDGKITPLEHIKVMAAFQKYTDNSISKTVNLPAESTVEDVAAAYEAMYALGCKGGTVYRDGSRDEQILSLEKDEPQQNTSIDCENCNGEHMVREGSCSTCQECGYSLCGL